MEKHTNEVEDNQMRALSWKTRVSYGLGDTACNVVYGMIGSLLTIFYTDYVGISAAAIGVIMLISRIFDGCSDVIMGFVVNKTHSKYGQSRPWIYGWRFHMQYRQYYYSQYHILQLTYS